MTIVFTAKGPGWDAPIDPRFGRAAWFVTCDESGEGLQARENPAAAEAHGAGPLTARLLADLDAAVLVTGNGPGGNAAAVLARTGVEIRVGAGGLTVREAFEAYRDGRLARQEAPAAAAPPVPGGAA